jgi:hypothetical protein
LSFNILLVSNPPEAFLRLTFLIVSKQRQVLHIADFVLGPNPQFTHRIKTARTGRRGGLEPQNCSWRGYGRWTKRCSLSGIGQGKPASVTS